jgi:poly-gamma-glutamate synthesis protein (capsule biosynthesis protein)
MYFANMDILTGRLASLHMTPMQISRFRLYRASGDNILWLKDTLNREGRKFGTWVELESGDMLALRWIGQNGAG